MAVAEMDITDMVENLSVAGVLPAGNTGDATDIAALAALDPADVGRAKNLFSYGPSYPASTPINGKFNTPTNGDLLRAIAVVDALYEHEKGRFECKPGVFLDAAEGYGYFLADLFQRQLPSAQKAFEIGKRAIKQAGTAAARVKQAAKAARKGKPTELRDGLAAAAREQVRSQPYDIASLFGTPGLPFVETEADAEGTLRQMPPPPAAGPTVTTPVTEGATPHHAPVGGLAEMEATTLLFGAAPSDNVMKSEAEFEKWRALGPAAVTAEAKATRLLEVGLFVAEAKKRVAGTKAAEAKAVSDERKAVEAAAKSVEAARKAAEAELKAVEAELKAWKLRALMYEQILRDEGVLNVCDDECSGDESDL